MAVAELDAAPAAAAPSGKTPIYEGSTQFRNWRYSTERLMEVRASMNEAAVAVIKRTLEAYEPGSSFNVSFLTASEEILLVKHYLTKITQLCSLFRFPEEVEATAVSYMKRFYLKNTVMDWHPKNVMLTALFLATKTTNNPISLETYTTHIKGTIPSDVIDLEFLVAQSLGFEFSVWHAHRALWGLWLDFQSLPNIPSNWPASHKDSYEVALNHVRESRLSDAELVYTPSQIALACMSNVFPEESNEWLKSKFPPEGLPAIQNTIQSIKDMMTTSGIPPDVESVREVDRRLRLCKNPEKVVGSKAYVARKEEQERKATEKRNRKAEGVGPDEDPFGHELTKGVDDDDDEDD
ncbi:cyclin-like protein [Hymenopellis radicata]|nr:cyclin-like protein [Hymenopellis radicata]